MEDNVKSFLDKVEQINNAKIKVDIISTGEKIEASNLTFKQQKELISTIADGTVGTLKFQKIINNIILDNTSNNTLLMTDKLPIILKLREAAIGENIKLDDCEVKIDSFLSKIKKLKFNTKKTIDGDFKIQLVVPTLTYENSIIQATIDTVKKDKSIELGKNIGDIYTHEIVKYIDTIEFGENKIVFKDISINDRLKIVNNLPISTNKKIIDFIQDIKSAETEFMTILVNGDKKIVDIDVSFFDS